MANPKNSTRADRGQVPAPSPAPRPADDLPVFNAIGWARVRGGWVVCKIVVQGDEILEREPISREPEPKAIASETLKLGLIRRILADSPSR